MGRLYNTSKSDTGSDTSSNTSSNTKYKRLKSDWISNYKPPEETPTPAPAPEPVKTSFLKRFIERGKVKPKEQGTFKEQVANPTGEFIKNMAREIIAPVVQIAKVNQPKNSSVKEVLKSIYKTMSPVYSVATAPKGEKLKTAGAYGEAAAYAIPGTAEVKGLSTAAKIARLSKVGAIGGAAFGGTGAIRKGETRPLEILKQTGYGAATGAALVPAVGLAGSKIASMVKKLAQAVKKKVGTAAEAGFITKAIENKPKIPTIDEAADRILSASKDISKTKEVPEIIKSLESLNVDKAEIPKMAETLKNADNKADIVKILKVHNDIVTQKAKKAGAEIPEPLKPTPPLSNEAKDTYGTVKEWGTQNQYVRDNPYRPQLDTMKKTGNYDTKVIQDASRWEMHQVLKDKPAYMSSGTLSPVEIQKFAKTNDLKIGYTKDNSIVIGKTQEAIDKVINAQSQRDLGLALGYKDISPQSTQGANKLLGEVKSYKEHVDFVREAVTSGDMDAAKAYYDIIPKSKYLPSFEEIANNAKQHKLYGGLQEKMAEQEAKYNALLLERQEFDSLFGDTTVDNIKRLLRTKFAGTSDFDVTKIPGFDDAADQVRTLKNNPNLSSDEVLDMIDQLPTKAEINAQKPIDIIPPKELEIIEPEKVDEIIKTNEAGGEVTKVPETQLPVGAGKEKVSRLEARVKGLLGKITPEEKANLSTFSQMNKESTIKDSVKFSIEKPKEAMKVLEGKKAPPEGLTHNSIALAMQEVAKDSGDADLALKLASLRSTRMGQELSLLTEIDKNNPVRHIDDLIKRKIEAAGGEEKVKVARSKATKELGDGFKETIKQSVPNRSKVADFIESIRCK